MSLLFQVGIMMRWLLCAAIFMACSGQAVAIDIWLSSSSAPSAPPAVAGSVPTIDNFGGSSGSVFVWARPDDSKILERWSLRLKSNDPNVLDFLPSEIEPYNLLIEGGNFPDVDPADVVRWEFTHAPAGNSSQVDLFGFNISAPNPARIAKGIGTTLDLNLGTLANECDANDQFCGLASDNKNSWLLAKINYTLSSVGNGQTKTTDLFFQIGSAGINQVGESSSDAMVTFGYLGVNEAQLIGTQRLVPSQFADGKITVHPNLIPTGGYDAADFNTDHNVDGADFLIWQRGFGLSGLSDPIAAKLLGDATAVQNDDRIDEIDLAAWRTQYGFTTPKLSAVQNATVPEPTTGAIAGCMLMIVLARRRTLGRFQPLKTRGANS